LLRQYSIIISMLVRSYKKKGSATHPSSRLILSLWGISIGDPDNDIKAGTAFEDLPDDWVCPDCGVGKEEFEPVDD